MRWSQLSLAIGLLALVAAHGVAWAADDPAKTADKKKSEHKITQSVTYLSIDPIYTTIVEDDRPAGMLMVGIGLDIPDAGLRDAATRSMPLLRDAYLRNLMAFSATSVRSTAQPDVEAIAGRLQSITDHALGKKGAKVLLSQVALRVTN
jgi:flagellar basal body-associated protein FliL